MSVNISGVTRNSHFQHFVDMWCIWTQSFCWYFNQILPTFAMCMDPFTTHYAPKVEAHTTAGYTACVYRPPEDNHVAPKLWTVMWSIAKLRDEAEIIWLKRMLLWLYKVVYFWDTHIHWTCHYVLSLFLGALPTVFAMETIYWDGITDINVKSMKLICEEAVHFQKSKKPVYVFAICNGLWHWHWDAFS